MVYHDIPIDVFDQCLQISKTQYDKVHGYIEAGKNEGAKVILGGEKRPGKGFFIDPTSQPFCLFTLLHNFEKLHRQFSPTSDQT